MSREYVYLSIMAGYSDLKLVMEDLLPTIATYAFMSFVLFINGVIMGEAGLSLIGLRPTQGISIMLTKSIETFQKPHYPLNRGYPPNQLLTKQVPQDEQLNTLLS